MANTTKILHIVSLNTQGLRGDKMKRVRLKEWLKQQKADIAFLQETHFSLEMTTILSNEFNDWKLYHSFGETNSKGCTILIKKVLDCKVIDIHSSNDGRYILINVETANNTYSLLNIYSPNNKNTRNAFFKNISSLLLEQSQGIKVVGGDFNETLNNELDRKSTSTIPKTNATKSTQLKTMIKENNLSDIWRDLHPHTQQFT